VNPSAKAVAQDCADLTAAELLDALATAADIRRAAGEFFAHYDFLLCPATAALAWPADNIFPPQIDDKPVGPRGHAVFTAWMMDFTYPAAVLLCRASHFVTRGGSSNGVATLVSAPNVPGDNFRHV
jgi:aspartyl-tRNA(Asn)/glutamyl-tRNA(Gln) amidotransferase subunit A